MANQIMTLKGTAQWAKVFEPDTKFDANGVYSINLVMPEADAAAVGENLDEMAQAKFAEEVKRNPKVKNTLSIQPSYQPEYDDNGEETGNVVFKCKLKAKIQTRDGRTFEQRPVVVDAKRQPLDGSELIGNGSLVKVAFEPTPYVVAGTKTVGVSLRLKGVQVLEMNSYGSGGAMFDEEEGYVAEKVTKDTSGDAFNDAFNEDYEGDVDGDF